MEDDPLSPVTGYGRAKAEAEARVAAAHPGALLVRTSLIYGGAEPSKHELAARDRGAHVLHERDPQPDPGHRPRAGAARAGRARRLRPAARRRRRRRLARGVRRADRGCARARRRAPRRRGRSTARSTPRARRRCCGRGFAASARSSARSSSSRSAISSGRFAARGERVHLRGGPLERLLDRAAHARLDPLGEPGAEVLRLPRYGRRRRRRHVRLGGLGCRRRRRGALDLELEDPLGLVDVLQPPLAEREDRDALRQRRSRPARASSRRAGRGRRLPAVQSRAARTTSRPR